MASDRHADLLFTNARVVSFDPSPRSASFNHIAVKGGRIIHVGGPGEETPSVGPTTKIIDCQGMALAPGFVDAHCHLMGLASSLRGVDCRPDAVKSVSDIVRAIQRRAEHAAPGTWIRAFGYEEFYLKEARHPNRWDLDIAAPDHPVRLDHRSGHASVLNSRALELVGIGRETAGPVDGVIERDDATGEPTGLLLEMGEYLGGRMGGEGVGADLLEGVGRANELLLSRGITSVQDASPGNDPARWRALRSLKESGHLTPRVTMMAGSSHLKSFLSEDLTPGVVHDGLRLGAVKVMLTLTTGALQPAHDELMEMVLDAHRRGIQVAFHAVEEEAVGAAADVLCRAQEAFPRPGARHRIEHCSECPPALLRKVRASGAMVVTQPGFVYHNGDRYLSTVEDRLIPHLYPLASLMRSGVRVAAGSDAPVTEPNPLLGIYSAVTRKTRAGSVLSPEQVVSVRRALKMHTLDGAFASFDERNTGSIRVGKRADLVLLDRDPRDVEPDGIKETRVVMTVVGGEVAWQS